MTASIIVHFGSPRNRREVGPFLKDVFSDYIKPLATFAAALARPFALKKYEAVGFQYSREIEEFAGRMGNKFILASKYGKPSIKDALNIMDESGEEHAVVAPLFPHASLEMFDSVVKEFLRLERSRFRGMHFKWIGPFFDHPSFIKAWAASVTRSLSLFEDGNPVHIIFCAHAIPGDDPGYRLQVEKTADLVVSRAGLENPTSVAYQSAMKIGRWSGPAVGEEVRSLAAKGVSRCIIAPVSFLFDNVETLFDIDRVVIPAAKTAGMKEVRRAVPPGGSQEIIGMFESMS